MKRKLVIIVVILAIILAGGYAVVSGINPLKKAQQVPEPATPQTAASVPDSEETTIAEIDSLVSRTVEKINAGKWGDAINAGEDANRLLTALVKRPSVKESVYTINSIKEKVYETLVEGYDYKNHMEGLSQQEKEHYVRTARDHYYIDTTNPFKKQALAKVLIETGNFAEGLKFAAEVYNSPQRNKDVTDIYAWGLYLAGRKPEAFGIYRNFYSQSETLLQMYHAAVVIEEQDKVLGLKLYKGCLKAGNNLMVKEENTKNQSAESYINKILTDAQKAIDRLLASGSGVDSQYKTDQADNIVNSIVKL